MFRIAIFGVIGLILFAAWFEYKDMQKRISVLRENNAKLEIVAQESQKTIDALKESSIRIEQENKTLQINLQKSEEYKDNLLEKLQRHDLTKLSLKRPGMIEKRINNATKKIFDDIESLTSSVVSDNN